MLNTARIIHMMFLIRNMVAHAHLHRPILWVGCFSRAPHDAITHIHYAGCMVVTLAPHLASVRW